MAQVVTQLSGDVDTLRKGIAEAEERRTNAAKRAEVGLEFLSGYFCIELDAGVSRDVHVCRLIVIKDIDTVHVTRKSNVEWVRLVASLVVRKKDCTVL